MMRTIAEAGGGVRLWYAIDEIERITAAALREAELWPGENPCAIDIERLLEVHLGAVVDYSAPLDSLVLGYTSFQTPVRVAVNRILTEAAHQPGNRTALARWRATLAHEAAHILLHSRLYTPATPAAAKVRCLRAEIAAPRAVDWREVQANMGMGALLLPRPIAIATVGRILASVGPVIPPLHVETPVAHQLISGIAVLFAVSRQVALIRLQGLGFLQP
jgi:hypothetical protein